MKLLKPTITFSLFALSLIISIHVHAQLTPQWQAYFGGSGNESIFGSIICSNGDVVLWGETNSNSLANNQIAINNIYSGGATDGFITRFNDQGEMLWWTFFGGTKTDYILQTIEDTDGNLWALGYSTGDVPTSEGAIKTTQTGLFVSDCFISKFDADGNWIEGTLIGGSEQEQPSGIFINSINQVVISGFTNSPGLGFGSVYDTELNTDNAIFIAVLNSISELNSFSYFEGNDAMYGNDIGDVSVKSHDGDFIIYGKSESTTGIATDNAEYTDPLEVGNGFIVKLNQLGFPVWGTFYNNYSVFRRIEILNEELFALYGMAWPEPNIATNGALQTEVNGQNDGFISIWNQDGALQWTTYFGGAEQTNFRDEITSIASIGDKIIFAGYADNNYNLNTPDAWQSDISLANTNYIGFFGWFSLTGSLEYCTYVLNPNASTRITGLSALTNSLYTPIRTSSYYNWVDSPGLNQNLGGSADICLMKWDLPTSIEAFEKPIEVVVYPNPASNQIYFTGLNMARSHVDIIDNNGVLCMSSSSNGSLDISSLSSGVYIAQITTLDKTHHTVKFIKQ